MLGSDITAFLESGCALIVATVDGDGAPHATRGWGVTVLPREGRLRLLLDADDVTTLENARTGGAIAVTGADVPSFRSVQVKGRAEALEPGDTDDQLRAARYYRAFFSDIAETDGTPWELMERMIPTEYVACTVVVEELFDQTPGPGAGAELGLE